MKGAATALRAQYRGGRWFESTAAHQPDQLSNGRVSSGLLADGPGRRARDHGPPALGRELGVEAGQRASLSMPTGVAGAVSTLRRRRRPWNRPNGGLVVGVRLGAAKPAIRDRAHLLLVHH